jgi:hypothetical protein
MQPIATASAIKNCIEACQRCHQVCLQTAMTYCLQQGGPHAKADHLRIMLNCAELCQTAANFMLSEAPQHTSVCGVCAEVCAACALSCEQIGQMDECAKVCRHCARECERMARKTPTSEAAWARN